MAEKRGDWKVLMQFMRKLCCRKSFLEGPDSVWCRDLNRLDVKMETVATIDFNRREKFSKQERCCFCLSLKLGLNIWLPIEALIWILLAIAAFAYEIVYINKDDLLDFVDETEDWYFYLVFGDRFYYLDQRIRSKLEESVTIMRCCHVTLLFLLPAYIILVNFLLILVFLTYFAFCLVLLFGVNRVSFRTAKPDRRDYLLNLICRSRKAAFFPTLFSTRSSWLLRSSAA